MKTRIVLVFTVVALLLTGPLFAQVTIIANHSVPETTISQNELGEIFLGKRVKWSNNSRIDIVVSQAQDLHASFLKEYVGRSPSQFEIYWRKMLFTGQAQMPVSFKTDQDVINYVANTPGAIGYVSSQPASSDIKIISVR